MGHAQGLHAPHDQPPAVQAVGRVLGLRVAGRGLVQPIAEKQGVWTFQALLKPSKVGQAAGRQQRGVGQV
jgi:hypothetical protein